MSVEKLEHRVGASRSSYGRAPSKESNVKFEVPMPQQQVHPFSLAFECLDKVAERPDLDIDLDLTEGYGSPGAKGNDGGRRCQRRLWPLRGGLLVGNSCCAKPNV